MTLAIIEEAETSEEKLTVLKDLVKDVDLIQAYFDDPEAVIESVLKLSSEGARLEAISKLVRRVVDIKNDFVKEAVKLEAEIKRINQVLEEVVQDKYEITKEMNNARMITLGLVTQLIEMSKIIKQANFDPETLRKLVEQTKTYIAKCESCKKEIRGTIEKISSLTKCKKCNEDYVIYSCYRSE